MAKASLNRAVGWRTTCTSRSFFYFQSAGTADVCHRARLSKLFHRLCVFRAIWGLQPNRVKVQSAHLTSTPAQPIFPQHSVNITAVGAPWCGEVSPATFPHKAVSCSGLPALRPSVHSASPAFATSTLVTFLLSILCFSRMLQNCTHAAKAL